jgi:hypothetical protein
MLLIDKEAAKKEVNTIKENLANLGERAVCITGIKRLIDIKQSHLWRSDFACCGAVGGSLSCMFETELGILQDALAALEQDRVDEAAAQLEDYLACLEENYGDERVVIKGLELGKS